jgi:chaperonin GroES
MSSFVPWGDRVAVRRVEAKKQTAGGIIIPDAAQEKQSIGVIVATGPKVDTAVRVDDTVIFGKYTGTEVVVGDETLVVMSADDVLGKVVG